MAQDERDLLQEAREAAKAAGFIPDPYPRIGSPEYIRSNGYDTEDWLNIYPHMDGSGGEFGLNLHGPLKDLPAILNPITPEQVRQAVVGMLAPHFPGMWVESVADAVLRRLTGGDPPGQRTTQPG